MSSSDEAPQEHNTWWSKPGFLICAILLALLVAVTLVLVLFPSKKDEDPTSAAAPTSSSSAPAASGGSVCGLDATGGTTLTKAPKDVTWTAQRSLYLPTSKEHGPGQTDPSSQVRTCFSRTPEGALLSATSMLGSSTDPNLLVETLQARGVDSPGKTIAVGKAQQRASSGDQTIPPMEIEGFRVLSFTKDAATVEVVVGVDTGSEKVHRATAADMVWQDGDWKFTFADDGSGGPTGSQVSDLSNYVRWSSNG